MPTVNRFTLEAGMDVTNDELEHAFSFALAYQKEFGWIAENPGLDRYALYVGAASMASVYEGELPTWNGRNPDMILAENGDTSGFSQFLWWEPDFKGAYAGFVSSEDIMM